MIRDMNSKIEFIEYDKLDHPIRIQFMDGSNIQYVYAADGRKLKVTHQTAVDNLTVSANRKLDQPETQQKTTRLPAVDNTIVSSDRKLDLSESQLKSQTVQYYMGNFVLTNGILDRYYFGSDGYAKFTNGKPVYSSRIKGYTYSTVKSSDVLLNPEYRVTQNVYPYYFVKDHLGSNRMVADSPSTMVSYYPYGGIYYDDILFYQADDNHLYNGKEMDRMYGLDTYDHGARQYNPARITWDRMDPLAEKYYHINPYLYCAGNPVNYVDPDGKEVRDGVGPYCADDRNNKALAKDLAAHNDPNSIMIVAHGVYENENSRFATSIDIQTYNPSTKEWNHNVISDGKQLDSFLSANSKTWNRYKNGKINAEDLHIVFIHVVHVKLLRKFLKMKHSRTLHLLHQIKRYSILKIRMVHGKQGSKER